MKRWDMLEDGEMPEPNINIRLAYAPLLNRMRNNIVEMGLEPERLYTP